MGRVLLIKRVCSWSALREGKWAWITDWSEPGALLTSPIMLRTHEERKKCGRGFMTGSPGSTKATPTAPRLLELRVWAGRHKRGWARPVEVSPAHFLSLTVICTYAPGLDRSTSRFSSSFFTAAEKIEIMKKWKFNLQFYFLKYKEKKIFPIFL